MAIASAAATTATAVQARRTARHGGRTGGRARFTRRYTREVVPPDLGDPIPGTRRIALIGRRRAQKRRPPATLEDGMRARLVTLLVIGLLAATAPVALAADPPTAAFGGPLSGAQEVGP